MHRKYERNTNATEMKVHWYYAFKRIFKTQDKQKFFCSSSAQLFSKYDLWKGLESDAHRLLEGCSCTTASFDSGNFDAYLSKCMNLTDTIRPAQLQTSTVTKHSLFDHRITLVNHCLTVTPTPVQSSIGSPSRFCVVDFHVDASLHSRKHVPLYNSHNLNTDKLFSPP